VNNRQDLQRKLEQTKRLSALVGDLTTRQRLLELRDELIEALEKFPQRREHILIVAFASARMTSGNSMAVLTVETRSSG
jgi:hypothetical protein